jgi:transcriptional regulator with XRE-family HTH domain
MIEDYWPFDTSGHERTLVHVEFLSPGDSVVAGLARPHRLAQRHVWQELHSARRPESVRQPILRFTAAAAREQRVTRVLRRQKLHRNGPAPRRKVGREPHSPAHRSLGFLLCPSPLSERHADALRKFRVKLRLKLPRATFPPGSGVSKLLISHSISHAQWAAEWEGAERVSDFGSSAVRQRRLADELRRLRKRSRLTGKDVATRLGWSEAKLSRIENGLARVKRPDLDAFMDLYKVANPHRSELIALAEESHQADLLEEFEGDLPEGHRRFLEAEQEAKAMWNWEPQVVPGLLQIENYTRALLQLWPAEFGRPPAEMERRVETRLLRRNVLSKTPPLELSFVIDESVLLRGFAAAPVMREQLAHLADMSEHPNIELRVLPLGGRQASGTGAFVYFRFPTIHGMSVPDAVALEYLQGTTFIEAEQDVYAYQVVFRALREAALSTQASRDMLARVSREAWQ